MKNNALASWLETGLTAILQTDDPLCRTIFETIIHATATGQLGMMEAVLGAAARSAAETGRPLPPLLNSLNQTRLIVWERLDAEIDPANLWEMLLPLESFFDAAQQILVQNYLQQEPVAQQQPATATRLSLEAEERVIAYAAQLARANRDIAKLEKAKTDFINIAAHELKTPLTLIKGYLNMILEQEGVLSVGNDLVITGIAPGTFTGIDIGIARLEMIINDLIDIAAIEIGNLDLHPEQIVPARLIAVLVEKTRDKIGLRDLEFTTNFSADLPPITTDAKRLYQILSRLVNNAVRYTPDGGKITISARTETLNGTGKSRLKIEVADTGIGISPEDRDRIFDKFYRVGDSNLHSTGKIKFKGAGPGLGLSIVKGLVETLDGQVWAESPGHDEINCPGSTFHVRLPVD